MKSRIIALLILTMAATAMAIDKAELERRVQKLTAKFEAMQQKPDKRVPAEHLRKAHGVILLDRTKAGFIFAYQGGSGVAMVKDKSGKWGPMAFLRADEGSLGFQIGGQQSFIVILLMNPDSARKMSEATFDFGGEARGTAGESSTGAEGVVSSTEASVLVYDDRSGLFGGAAIKGGSIAPDEDANRAYYGKFLTTKEVLLEKKVKPNDQAKELARKLDEYSKKK